MRIPAALHPTLALALALLSTACSSSSSSATDGGSSVPCNQNPWECAAAQTCWPQNQSTFACLNAGPGKLGEVCMNTEGSPTCGAGLACFQALGGTTGSCVAYCSTTDPSHACDNDAVCQTATLGAGATFSICVLPATGGTDAGVEASPAADSGSAGDAPAAD